MEIALEWEGVIFLFKSFGSDSLFNWFTFIFDNLGCLQFFCAFDESGPSGYMFLIIHCVDCYVFIF